MTADAAGSLTWTQDLVEPHLLFIQTVPSTIFIDDTRMGDCVSDDWDLGWGFETCTLTNDLDRAIQIDEQWDYPGRGWAYCLEEPGGNAAGVFIPSGTYDGCNSQKPDHRGVRQWDLPVQRQELRVYVETQSRVTDNGIKLFPAELEYMAAAT